MRYSNDYDLNHQTNYKVIGDLLFVDIPADLLDGKESSWAVSRLTYHPNGSDAGDIIIKTGFVAANGDQYKERTSTWLRIKQNLDLAGKSYDYSNIYLSNVKGQDKDIDIMGFILNFANTDGSKLDKMLKSILFHVEFPNANTIKYSYQSGENKDEVTLPIVVEGNKMTINMSEKGSALKDITLYAFQDQNNTQMHLYMHRDVVVDFYTNMQAFLDTWTKDVDVVNDAAAVKAIYDSFDQAIESINLTIILK